MTTDTTKKKTSRVALSSLFLGFLVFGAGATYIGAYSEHWDSLHTNSKASDLMGLCLPAWFLSSAVTFFVFLSSISRVIWSKGKLRGLPESICAIIIVLFTAALVMPTLGVVHSRHYKLQASRVAWEYFEECESNRAVESNTKSPMLSDYEVEIINNRSIYTEDPNIVEVVYTLKKDFGTSTYPRQFLVLLNFDTGEKSIKEVDSSEE